jgi:hypothetical protein
VARLFTFASSQSLKKSVTPVTAYPLTISCWLLPTTHATFHTLVGIGRIAGASPNHYWAVGHNATGFPFAASNDGTTEVDATHATAVVNGTWTHLCGVFTSATSRTIYQNGINPVTNAVSSIPLLLTGVNIGSLQNGTSEISFSDGAGAEVGIWNVALSAPEVTMLALGINPRLVRPSALVMYCPLRQPSGNEPDYLSATVFTASASAPTAVAHPLILGPRGGIVIPSAGVAAAPTNAYQ